MKKRACFKQKKKEEIRREKKERRRMEKAAGAWFCLADAQEAALGALHWLLSDYLGVSEPGDWMSKLSQRRKEMKKEEKEGRKRRKEKKETQLGDCLRGPGET